MSQRVSGFERVDHDHYPAPAWVIDALAEHVDFKGKGIWEPACGAGKMCVAIEGAGASYASGSDLSDWGWNHNRFDFVEEPGGCPWLVHYDGIVTNPPYGPRGATALRFIERGLERIRDYGLLALLLPVDFDSAKSRRHVFGDCLQFAGKIVLTKRIKWFEDPDVKSGPSANHAWFLWQRTWIGGTNVPWLKYAPTIEVAE